MRILSPPDITLFLLKWTRRAFCLGRAQFPLLAQLCAARVPDASSKCQLFPPPPPVAMVIAAEPGFHLASPARAERPLTCPRGLLGLKAGLPGVVTQHRLGSGGQGGSHMVELYWGGLQGSRRWPRCHPQGQEERRRQGGGNGLQTRREGQRRSRDARSKENCSVPSFPT